MTTLATMRLPVIGPVFFLGVCVSQAGNQRLAYIGLQQALNFEGGVYYERLWRIGLLSLVDGWMDGSVDECARWLGPRAGLGWPSNRF